MHEGHTGTSPGSLFLPDFCAIGTLFSVVVVGELLVFVLVLAAPTTDLLGQLAMTSLFVQWVALVSAGLLCAGRRLLQRLGDVGAGVAAWTLVLLVTGLLGEAAWQLVELPGFGNTGLRDTRLPFHLHNLGISAVVSAVALRYYFVQHQWKARVESEARARFQALQSRIRPHFLFNSMNTIASLTRTQPELAEQVVEDLADLFRASLGDAAVPATLERELEICREYLRIEAQRLGPRLGTEWALDALPMDALLPPLSLQPLLENAVYHGIEPAVAGGVLHVGGHFDGTLLHLWVENPLLAGGRGSERAGNHMALDNVRERLGAFFGTGSQVDVRPGSDRYRVEVCFPYRRAETDD